ALGVAAEVAQGLAGPVAPGESQDEAALPRDPPVRLGGEAYRLPEAIREGAVPAGVLRQGQGGAAAGQEPAADRLHPGALQERGRGGMERAQEERSELSRVDSARFRQGLRVGEGAGLPSHLLRERSEIRFWGVVHGGILKKVAGCVFRFFS